MKLKKLNKNRIKQVKQYSTQARAAILKMTTLAASGHPGGSMSTIDYLLTAMNMANIDPKNPRKPDRDLFIFSHGHVSPAAYSALGIMKFFDLDKAISQFRLTDSIFEGHVEPDVPGIEWASGNLGQGLSAACGFAIASKIQKINRNIFVLMGDGEQQKGQLNEARVFAVKYDLSNIIAFIDYNKLQISGSIEKIMPQNIKAEYEADGWNVLEIYGHDFNQIQNAILEAETAKEPTAILAKTKMGKGVSFMENKEQYHGAALKEDELSKALQELGFENDLDKYKKMRETPDILQPSVYPQPKFNFQIGKPRLYDEKIDNRSAWGNAIADIAKLNPNSHLALTDNDLQGSLKTAKFEEVMPHNFFECGIMEHHTATMAGAISKAGVQTFFPGFGVFAIDETYNMHRLNDINHTHLKIVTTHVGLDVGEDGKTHQCIDYLGVFKNLFHFKIIIPADANQTDHVIRYVVNKPGNYLIAMGRSKYEQVKTAEGEILFNRNYKFEYGKADQLRTGNKAALMVMGTMTTRALEIANRLQKIGIDLQVWNISSPLHLDEKALREAAATGIIFSYEDHNVHTGLGSCIATKLVEMNLQCKLYQFGVRDYSFSGNSADVFKKCKLDVQSIYHKIKKMI
ncbi:MAG: transketolase [Candidatus Cloacimonadota bacterium]|nr:transketolase [Candidatus Cloacimonadota bacterium]